MRFSDTEEILREHDTVELQEETTTARVRKARRRRGSERNALEEALRVARSFLGL